MDIKRITSEVIRIWNTPMDYLRLKRIIALTVFVGLGMSLLAFFLVILLSGSAGAAQAFQAAGAVAAVLPGFAGVIVAAVALYSYIKTEDPYYNQAKHILNCRRALVASIVTLQNSFIYAAKRRSQFLEMHKEMYLSDEAQRRAEVQVRKDYETPSNKHADALAFRNGSDDAKARLLAQGVKMLTEDAWPKIDARREWLRFIMISLKSHAPHIRENITACNSIMLYCKALEDQKIQDSIIKEGGVEASAPSPDQPTTPKDWLQGTGMLLLYLERAERAAALEAEAIDNQRRPVEKLDDIMETYLLVGLLMTIESLEGAGMRSPDEIYQVLRSPEFSERMPLQTKVARELTLEKWRLYQPKPTSNG